MELEEEREILAIVVPTQLRAAIMDAVNTAHGLRSKALKGLLYELFSKSHLLRRKRPGQNRPQ